MSYRYALQTTDINALQVGDEVALVSDYYQEPRFVTVAKRTATQVVLSDGKRFNERNKQIGMNEFSASHMIFTDVARDMIANEAAKRERQAVLAKVEAFPFRNLTVEQLREVEALLASYLPAKVQHPMHG